MGKYIYINSIENYVAIKISAENLDYITNGYQI